MPYQDADDRRTYPTPLGELRSVTSYLDEMPKPWALGWSAKVTAEYFKDHLELIKSGELKLEDMSIQTLVKEAKAHHKVMSEQAMDIGKEVHKAVEDFFSFGPEPKDETIKELAAEIVNALMFGLKARVRANEVEVYHKLGYAGTLDIVGMVKPRRHRKHRLAVIDLKTSSGIYLEGKLQVAAYAEAYEEMHNEEVEFAIVLRIDKETGKADAPFIMNRTEWKRHYRVFAKLVKLAQAKDKLKGRKRK